MDDAPVRVAIKEIEGEGATFHPHSQGGEEREEVGPAPAPANHNTAIYLHTRNDNEHKMATETYCWPKSQLIYSLGKRISLWFFIVFLLFFCCLFFNGVENNRKKSVFFRILIRFQFICPSISPESAELRAKLPTRVRYFPSIHFFSWFVSNMTISHKLRLNWIPIIPIIPPTVHHRPSALKL